MLIHLKNNAISKKNETHIFDSEDEFINEFEEYTKKSEKFNYDECELIRKLLINPSFKMSLENAVLYAKGLNGYAYILGVDEKEKFKKLVKY